MIITKEQGKIILNQIKEISEEKQIDETIIFSALKEALIKTYEKAYERKTGDNIVNITVTINEETGEIQLYRILKVVHEVLEPALEISLEQAKAIDINLKVGDESKEAISSSEFTRLEIFQAIQIVKQAIKEAEKKAIFEEFEDKKGEILTGFIETIDDHYMLVRVNRAYAYLPKRNQIPGQKITPNENYLKFYLEDFIKNKSYGYGHLLASRVHPNFLKQLLELEIPEFSQKNLHGEPLIMIKEVARIPGIRAKVAIISNDKNIDAIGACIGLKGMRIQTVSKELNGEKIDVVLYDEDPKKFIINALAPAKAIAINLDENLKKADIIVPNEQYSLAIGKDGLAARLVAQLTHWKISIISLQQAIEQEIKFTWNGNLKEEEYNEFVNSLLVKNQFRNLQKK